MVKSITFSALLCFCTQMASAQSGLQMFDESYVHEIRLYFDDPNFWQTLSDHYQLEDLGLNTPLLSQVTIDGHIVDSVGVTQKGFFSNWGAGNKLKKPLKLDFNAFVEGGKYDDLKSLNLQNAFKDPSFMRDMLSYRILRDFGVAAPRTAYAKVYLNDTYWGLYIVVESVNKTFLKEHFGNNDGNLYKAGFTSMQYLGDDQSAYSFEYELKTNETTNDWSRLIHLLKVISNTPSSKFRDSLITYMDMESYFKSMAVDVTIVNWDSHFDHGRNFYLYDNPTDGKFYWIPWDYNLAFAGNFPQYDITIEGLRSGLDYDKVLPKRVLSNTALKQEYLQYACQLHLDVFKAPHLFPIIDQAKTLIEQEVDGDPNKFYPNLVDFQTSLTIGCDAMTVDSFHLVDSVWNGSMWVVTDTVFVFEYEEQFPGLKTMIAQRHAVLQSEISNDFGVTCISPATEPLPPLGSEALQIWPNPVTDLLHVRLPASGGILSLYDVHGRLLMRGRFDSPEFDLSVQDYLPGVYWIEADTEEGRSIKKVIVAR